MATPQNHQDESDTICIHAIWLDATIWDDDNKDSKETQKKLGKNFGRCNFVTTTNDCEKVITKSFGDTKFTLIVSGTIGSKFVPEIHENEKYSSIYVFCGNKTAHEVWAARYKKVKFVSNNLDELISRIRADHPSP